MENNSVIIFLLPVVCLGMAAQKTDFRGGLVNVEISAILTFPDDVVIPFEYLAGFYSG